MAKIRIKDVAELAGVSRGTVDRVIHNRGKISGKSRQAVEKALAQMDYHTNIHVSALSLKRNYNIVIAMPCYNPGEYWEQIVRGIDHAIAKYSGLNVDCEYLYYNQFDLFSCRKAYEDVLVREPDAVVIGPTFRDETIYLANQLTDARIPYIFIDSTIDATAPLAYFMADLDACGYLMARLITSVIDKNGDIAIMQAPRIGDESANTTIIRKAGFLRYCQESGFSNEIIRVPYSPIDVEENEKLIGDCFQKHPNVQGIVVFNSRGHMIADHLEKHRIQGVKIVAIDLLEKNIEALKKGYIDFVLGQRPVQQGYMAMKTLFMHLVYGQPVQMQNVMPLDIITKENVDGHVRFDELSVTN